MKNLEMDRENMLDQQIESNFLEILKEELVPAMGCTEPISLAYAAAKGRFLFFF